MGYGPSGSICSSMGPPWAAVSAMRTYSRVGSPQAEVLQYRPAPPWALRVPQLLWGISTCSRAGFSMDCSMNTCYSMMSSHTAGKYLLHQGCFQNFHGLQASLCSGARTVFSQSPSLQSPCPQLPKCCHVNPIQFLTGIWPSWHKQLWIFFTTNRITE